MSRRFLFFEHAQQHSLLGLHIRSPFAPPRGAAEDDDDACPLPVAMAAVVAVDFATHDAAAQLGPSSSYSSGLPFMIGVFAKHATRTLAMKVFIVLWSSARCSVVNIHWNV